MTCYESLPAAAPADDVFDTSMAQHFVKWWRNKFRNGYKKFSHFTDSERTDTEELIGRASPQCSAPPDILPSEARALLQPNSPTKVNVKEVRDQSPLITYSNENEKPPRLKFEELTCDVELQHPQPSKQKPLQFSFTLYDLDGHGRMTKDDIAGIVSTIYESIGKSVTVPHYGSKTIQVKLTVIPENDRQERPEGRRRRKREKHTIIPNEYLENSDEEHQERVSPDDDVSSKSSGSVERRKERSPPPPQQNRHRHHSKEQRYRKRHKKRSGSLQRRELLEIIQANMEKNHLNFQTSRKTSENANDEELPVKAHKTRNRSFTISEKPAASTFHNNKIDNGYGYLDLASGQGHGDSNLCRYDRYLHAVICSSAKHAHSGYHQKQTQKSRPANTAKARLQEMIHPNPTNPRVLQIIFL